MFLTAKQSPLPRDPNKFPTAQLFILALCRIAEPIALTSIFPYAWKLVLHYNVGDENDAAFYAGVLVAAFSLAEAMTGMYWGGVSDRVGRKPVLLLGCAGTFVSLLVVGFATNFWVALFGRLLGGMLNGNIGVIQTMVGEITINPKHEPRAFAVMPFVWSLGTIVGPSIGGYFATPAENFPNVFSPSGIFGVFPFLLPNVICALLLLGSILAGYFFLVETHPDMQPWSTQADLDNTTAETPLLPAQGALGHSPTNLADQESYGTFDSVNIEDRTVNRFRSELKGRPSSLSSASSDKAFTKGVMMLILALGIFTYHSMAFDHLLPIFLQDARNPAHAEPVVLSSVPRYLSGGLGLSMQQVGIIMSINGLIALLVQAVVFPVMASWLGVWKLFVLATLLHPISSFIVPYLVLLPDSWVYTCIYGVLSLRNFSYILAYPLLLILLKEASPSSSHLGKINGLAASTGGACRTIASPVAGMLYGLDSNMHFSALAWWAGAAVAILGVLQVPFIKRQKKMKAHISTIAAFAHGEEDSNEEAGKKCPTITVEEIYGDDV